MVRQLRQHGVEEIVFLLYYRPDPIQQFFGDGTAFGFRARYVVATEDYGTAGAIKTAGEVVDDTCLVVSGDLLARIDYEKLVSFHRDRGALLTMGLTRVKDPTPFGNVEVDGSGRIVRFVEKPAAGELLGNRVNMGIYVVEPALLDRLPPGRPVSFERELFPRLIAEHRDLFAIELSGYWRDLGMVDQYLAAHRDALLGRWVRSGDDGALAGCLSRGRSLVGESSRVHTDAVLFRSTIGRRCTIGCGARLWAAVLWDDVQVGAGARLRRCVVGSRTVIGPQARIEPMAVIGADCRIGAGCVIAAGVRLGPNARMPGR